MSFLTYGRIEQRKDNFMKGSTRDMMGKNGSFAVSLRKSKRQQAVKKYREEIEKNKIEDEDDDDERNNDVEIISLETIESLLNSMNQDNYLVNLGNIKYICRGERSYQLIPYPDLISRLILLLNNQYEDRISEIIMDIIISLTGGSPSTTFKAMNCLGYDCILYSLDPLRPLTSYKTLKALSNLAADSQRIRLKLIDIKAHEHILHFCQSSLSTPFLQVISKFFKDLLSENNIIPNEIFEVCLPLLKAFIHESDTTIIGNSLDAINSFCNENQTRIKLISTQDFLNIIRNLCTHTSMTIIEKAIVTIGNISYSNDYQTRFLVENNIFDLFCITIEASSGKVRKETAYAISNIISDGDFYIEKLIDHVLIDKIISKLEDNDSEVQREISYIMFNLSSKGQFRHFKALVDKMVFSYIRYPLLRNDSKTIFNNLSFICAVLESYKSNDCYEAIESMEDTQCIITIENLRKSFISSHYEKISKILSFFENDFSID
ncbi:hypothetical protein SteCoe_17883 [Stentor coeruleus]|uniref:Importin subunit alpha n=1 Tax=Stentor coeruleus TaxID=5963 RepID=A0A1R2BXT2_9CILI|nr:hypothetical protein SteCoe_17883 [Stentor coeruleus]